MTTDKFLKSSSISTGRVPEPRGERLRGDEFAALVSIKKKRKKKKS